MKYSFSIGSVTLLLGLISACSGQNSANKPVRAQPDSQPVAGQPIAATAPIAAKVAIPPTTPTPRTMAQVGLLEHAFDKATKPCDDFYQYACGTWISKAAVTPAAPARSRVLDLKATRTARVSQLLATATAGHTDPAIAKLGAYYRSCTDEQAVTATGAVTIAPLLDAARAVKDPASLAAALALLHRHRIWAGFRLGVAPDFKSATQLLYLDHGALGLRKRDAYLRYGNRAGTRRLYRKHVARLLQLAGETRTRARRAAGRVISIETQLAQARKLPGQRRNVVGMYHRVSRDELTKLSGRFDWPTYFAALTPTPLDALAVTTPRYFALLGKLSRRRFADWRAYLMFQVAQATANMVGGKARAEINAFAKVLRPSWRAPSDTTRCVADTRSALDHLVAQVVTTANFTSRREKMATALVATIANAFKANAAALTWLAAPTRAAATAKLDKLTLLVGRPATWKSDSLALDAGNYAHNALAARSAITANELAGVGKHVSPSTWITSADTVDVIYNWLANQLTVPAGVLAPPFFDETRSRSVNLGALALLVGNELTHVVDRGGSLFDAAGRFGSWWSRTDEREYVVNASCFIDQYSALTTDGRPVDGRQTLRENLADLSGARAAFRAHRAGVARAGEVGGLSSDQQFFVAMAQTWCGRATPAESKRMMQLSTHAPAQHRINGVVSNMPEFAAAFSCTSGQPMVRANVCTAW